jgi:superoxide dismutase
VRTGRSSASIHICILTSASSTPTTSVTGTAYALDYGAAHAKYIDAFVANLNWSVLDKRWQSVRK